MNRKIKVGITHGDINGIGYEVIIKAFANEMMTEICTPVLFGSGRLLGQMRQQAGLPDFTYCQIGSAAEARDGVFNVVCLEAREPAVKPGEESAAAGEYAVASLEAAVTALQQGQVDVLVTAPINKNSIQSDKFHFPGHTEYLRERLGEEGDDALMILFDEKMRVALVTTHLPISELAGAITKEAVAGKLKLLDKSLRRDFGIDGPKIAVLGLNPHAGDGGLLGKEEQEVIAPAIAEAQEEGITVFGPYPADGFFARGSYAKFDAVLAMYHDQGLAPFKGLGLGDAVNFTAGLPFVRTSPDHGTAFDIAGKNMADASSMRKAVYAACDIIRRRRRYDKACAHPLAKQFVAKGKDRNVDLSKDEEELK